MCAQTNVAWCYENGVGTAVNKTEAVKYYSLAAEQGDTSAQPAIDRINSFCRIKPS